MKRYLGLLAAAIALGALMLVFRVPQRVSPRGAEPPSEQRSIVEVALNITPESRLTPATVAVAKNQVVRLTVRNGSRLPATLTLLGYQDRLAISQVPPDSTWRGEFVADRPGEDFAWMLEGQPVGRLQVTGSHLVEGHR